ncbi:MAG TPA: V-type ATP synthase subunit D [Candidatus Enterenecus stercoripullorum]|nr:V-type ATP synthase subunit D [Candidatus Enterenecus stercoripullorum]
MAVTVTTPTRMELTRLKGRLRTAQRGHKLLKDKRDELLRRLLDTAGEARALRGRMEREWMGVHAGFTMAAALMGGPVLEQALMYPMQRVKLNVTVRNIVGVHAPRYELQIDTGGSGGHLPYGFAATSGELDDAVEALRGVLPAMVRLAEMEKTVQLLSWEIEKTRRRVNALEYVVIPNTQQAIRYISMKLEENSRATITRLMKVKEMLLEQSMAQHKALDAQALEGLREGE